MHTGLSTSTLILIIKYTKLKYWVIILDVITLLYSTLVCQSFSTLVYTPSSTYKLLVAVCASMLIRYAGIILFKWSESHKLFPSGPIF